MKRILVFVFVLQYIFTNISFAQVYSDKVVGKKNAALKDSLKVQPYPYILPIWGEKVAKMGYKLPYSAGLGINYFTQQSDLVINQLFVGFNNGPQYNLDEIVRFDGATATASTVNIRPDIWLLPFLNVYAILAKGKTSTAINAGIYVPDFNNNWTKITAFSTKANFDATSFGLGLTPTIGIGGGFMALDMNMTWTDISALDKPVFTFVFGPRIGKSFQLKKPEQTIAFWVGGFRVGLSSSTSGSIKLGEVIPTEGLQAKVDQGMQNVAQKQTGVDNWWNGLSNVEQKNPVNIAKYETANRALDAAGNLLTAVDGALSTAESSTVQYSLQKNLKDKWNFLIGSQFQMNKHFMIRAEYGFLGSRQQFLAGLQYRFGL
jgi:hypothetical protein